MTARTYLACGFCSYFSIKENPDQAVHGLGACNGYEGITGPVEPFVHATGRPCVQYTRAQDLTMRNRFVAKHQTPEDE